MDESNANKQETKKPEEEAGISKVEEKKGKLNRLKKIWDGFMQRLCPRRTRNGVNSDSSSNDIPKLTVVFDLDSTLIYSTKKKLFSNQERIDAIRHYVAIRPHCREVLQSVGEVANMMVYSAGTPKYVHHIVQLLDPEKTLFTKTGCMLKRTVWIDDLEESYPFQPYNGIVIKPWIGDPEDNEMTETITVKVLENVASLLLEKDFFSLRQNLDYVLTGCRRKAFAQKRAMRENIIELRMWPLHDELRIRLLQQNFILYCIVLHEDKAEKNKPDEEVGTSRGTHQTDISEDEKALNRFLEAVLLRCGFARKKNRDNRMQACVKSDSSSSYIQKLTVVFDLDLTLVYSSNEKLFPAQQCLASGNGYTAIRPYCDTLLKNLRPKCQIMIFSSGCESYVNEVRNLIDPNGEYFE
ncbi:Carboxy-terminal domain RNA polymerase II polypeptide A small phosphatase 1 [Trichinella nativa]|uniref:Mitochondrial import inner membrane translocase subunit TIM50 n=1 Tax=Trichinella nativa TaxID=6335 RepID=A0A0V1KQ73_9BILA|nr:Carboxy-terminal domain RNA polymerase II polypeptide A small phosphatase 1 [Trichinella nativa]